MSLPAVSVPVAVLVLAWDETTPAVRALVAAAEIADPLLDSVVVLVPAGPATDELTQEEFLPLDASILREPAPLPTPTVDELLPAPTAIALVAEAAEATATMALAAAPTTEVLLPAVSATSAAAGSTSSLPALSRDQPTPLVATLPTAGLIDPETFAVPAGPAVRVLRLSEYSLAALATYSHQALPAPTWVGAAAGPAAPYLGSSEALITPLPAGSLSSSTPTASIVASIATADSTANPVLAAELATAQHVAPAPATAAAVPGYPATEEPVAPDAEADATPAAAAGQTSPATADAKEPTTELSEEAAAELTNTFAVDVTPVQAGWPDALASLRAPAAFAEADTAAPATEPVAGALPEHDPLPTAAPAALLPATQQFNAPNLNFQVIQYARFAVPLALAAQPFGVIYAPAWPTWLAAQELRQRTGRPLVLHIATLAAQDEPLALAAGWPAEIQRQALHRADLILTETLALAQRLRHELDRPAHRVRPVPAADAAAVAQALRTAQVW